MNDIRTVVEPPPYGVWHRADFTFADLIGGYRPLLLGEHPVAGDQSEGWVNDSTGSKWYQHYAREYWSAEKTRRKIRTLRPLPPEDSEEYTHIPGEDDFRAALGTVLDWYQSDEEPQRPLVDILTDIGRDLPVDRSCALWVRRMYSALQTDLTATEAILGQNKGKSSAEDLCRKMDASLKLVHELRIDLMAAALPLISFGTHPVTLSEDDWIAIFQPQKNHLLSGVPFDDCMYETYGHELEFIQGMFATCPGRVWTLVEADGVQCIVAGMHSVNRLGYFVTALPWSKDADDAPYVELEDRTDHSEDAREEE